MFEVTICSLNTKSIGSTLFVDLIGIGCYVFIKSVNNALQLRRIKLYTHMDRFAVGV